MFEKEINDLKQETYSGNRTHYLGDIYCERLIQEWNQHGKIVLAIDFDSTISPWGTINNLNDIKRAISIVKLAREVGAYLTIWTACNSDRFTEIKKYCNSIGLNVDSINENPINLPFGLHKKIYYNFLLDDRASLVEALNMLEYCCYRVRCEKRPVTEQTVEF